MTTAASFTLHFTASGQLHSFAKPFMGFLFWHLSGSLAQLNDINSPIFLRIQYDTETNIERQLQNSCFLPFSPLNLVTAAKNCTYKLKHPGPATICQDSYSLNITGIFCLQGYFKFQNTSGAPGKRLSNPQTEIFFLTGYFNFNGVITMVIRLPAILAGRSILAFS